MKKRREHSKNCNASDNRSFLAMLRETSSLRTKSFDEEFQTAQGNPQHPSLHFKKVGRFWSARAGIDYRALSVADGDDPIWVWIGSHDEYKKIIKEDV